MAYNPERGSMYEWAKMKNDTNDFKQAMKRQDPQFNQHYAQVEAYSRLHRPFAGKPYSEWAGILQGLWTKVLSQHPDTPAYLASRASWYLPERYGKSVFQSYYGDSCITGKRADMVIIDDPLNTDRKGKKVKIPKPPKKTYNTVAVRFVRGTNLAKVYTYKVPKKVKLHLGEEIVVPSLFDGFTSNSIAVVVELHKEPQDTGCYDYKFITGRIVAVKE